MESLFIGNRNDSFPGQDFLGEDFFKSRNIIIAALIMALAEMPPAQTDFEEAETVTE